MDVIDQLQRLGFSQYEAQAYVALVQENPLNGYELAKVSGIPRANIYTVLQRLEDAGAVLRIAGPEGTRYVPIPAGELLAKLIRRYQASADSAAASLQQITTPPRMESVLNLQGYAEMIEQAQALLDRTTRHLLLSTWPEEALALAHPVQQALDRGVQITTLCLRGCPQPCPACQGAVFRYAIAPASDTRWLVVVSDESELLAGEIPASPAIGGGNKTVAVRTRQKMLVNLSASYIQNSIALAIILTHYGNHLVSDLDPQSLAQINHLRPLNSQGAWLEGMWQALKIENNQS